MNITEAKFILGAYRPSGLDAGDAEMQKALECAAVDPGLDAWFQAERTFDAAVAREVQSIPVPPRLRAELIAGLRVSSAAVPTTASPRRPWFSVKLLALAASVIFFVGGVLFYRGVPGRGSKTEWGGWQTVAFQTLEALDADRTDFDQSGHDPALLKSWLANHNSPTPVAFPGKTAGMNSLGCKSVDWNGRKVSIICFSMGNDGEVHLAVTDRKGLPSPPPENVPRFAQNGHWYTASWSEGDHAMMLATTTSRELLERVLQKAAAERGLPGTWDGDAFRLASLVRVPFTSPSVRRGVE